jgi:hypothetical protein
MIILIWSLWYSANIRKTGLQLFTIFRKLVVRELFRELTSSRTILTVRAKWANKVRECIREVHEKSSRTNKRFQNPEKVKSGHYQVLQDFTPLKKYHQLKQPEMHAKSTLKTGWKWTQSLRKNMPKQGTTWGPPVTTWWPPVFHLFSYISTIFDHLTFSRITTLPVTTWW